MRKIKTKREKKEKFRWMKVVDENKIKEYKIVERKENLRKKSKREKERE